MSKAEILSFLIVNQIKCENSLQVHNKEKKEWKKMNKNTIIRRVNDNIKMRVSNFLLIAFFNYYF